MTTVKPDHKFFKFSFGYKKGEPLHYSHTEVWEGSFTPVRICVTIKDHIGGGVSMESMTPKNDKECLMMFKDGRSVLIQEDITQ